MTIGERIKSQRELLELSQEELAKKLNYKSRSTINKIEMGINDITQSKIVAFAKALETTPSYLMGWDEPDTTTLTPLPENKIFMRPVFNSVSAGFGAVAQDNIVGYTPTYINCAAEQEQYIWINVVGDSMAPLIDDGSKILIKKQTSIDSGQIGVALIDNEDTVVKKIVYNDNSIELISVNPYYPPRTFTGSEVERVQVLGLVKEVSKSLQ